tara:strand:- start:1 stop:441 length:441 start_codon:yes stop_codon:yes gene_type:complete
LIKGVQVVVLMCFLVIELASLMTPEVIVLLYDDRKTMVNMLLLPLMFAASVVLLHFSETEGYEHHLAIQLFMILVPAIALLGGLVAMSSWLLKDGSLLMPQKRFWRLVICLVIIAGPGLWESMNHVDVCGGCYYYDESDMFSFVVK